MSPNQKSQWFFPLNYQPRRTFSLSTIELCTKKSIYGKVLEYGYSTAHQASGLTMPCRVTSCGNGPTSISFVDCFIICGAVFPSHFIRKYNFYELTLSCHTYQFIFYWLTDSCKVTSLCKKLINNTLEFAAWDLQTQCSLYCTCTCTPRLRFYDSSTNHHCQAIFFNSRRHCWVYGNTMFKERPWRAAIKAARVCLQNSNTRTSWKESLKCTPTKNASFESLVS